MTTAFVFIFSSCSKSSSSSSKVIYYFKADAYDSLTPFVIVYNSSNGSQITNNITGGSWQANINAGTKPFTASMSVSSSLPGGFPSGT